MEHGGEPGPVVGVPSRGARRGREARRIHVHLTKVVAGVKLVRYDKIRARQRGREASDSGSLVEIV